MSQLRDEIKEIVEREIANGVPKYFAGDYCGKVADRIMNAIVNDDARYKAQLIAEMTSEETI